MWFANIFKLATPAVIMLLVITVYGISKSNKKYYTWYLSNLMNTYIKRKEYVMIIEIRI